MSAPSPEPIIGTVERLDPDGILHIAYQNDNQPRLTVALLRFPDIDWQAGEQVVFDFTVGMTGFTFAVNIKRRGDDANAGR